MSYLNFNVMAKIDDQERFRKIQTRVFSCFESDLINQTLPPDDVVVTKNVLYYVLEEIKKRVSAQLSRIETICKFRIEFKDEESAIVALQTMFYQLDGLDEDFITDLNVGRYEKEKKNKTDEE